MAAAGSASGGRSNGARGCTAAKPPEGSRPKKEPGWWAVRASSKVLSEGRGTRMNYKPALVTIIVAFAGISGCDGPNGREVTRNPDSTFPDSAKDRPKKI